MICSDGFNAGMIGAIAGASGGAKWLVLSQLDRVITQRIIPSLDAPIHLIGSSIGSWRFCCYAQDDPTAAIERFETAYLEQRYSKNPDTEEISEKSREILYDILGPDGIEQIVTHPVLRLHVLTVRARLTAASDKRSILGASLLLAATANIVSRRSLGVFFARSLFFDPRDLPPFYDVGGFPLERTRLSADNLVESVLASGAIPLVLNGVPDIPGAPPGMYRDGGIIDYHLDLPTSPPGKITLFPHFFDQLIPGWFDKKLPWRRHTPANIDRTLVVSPSPEFIASLPNSKIPDRTDFTTMSPELRRKVWRSVVSACEALAEDFEKVIDTDQLRGRLEPL
jgi:hypothetical protein